MHKNTLTARIKHNKTHTYKLNLKEINKTRRKLNEEKPRQTH